MGVAVIIARGDSILNTFCRGLRALGIFFGGGSAAPVPAMRLTAAGGSRILAGKGGDPLQYVMSDLHGRCDLFLQMLEKLRFGDGDALYYLGDAADRGPDGIPVIRALMARPNVQPLLGNHEDMFRRAIRWKFGPPPRPDRTEGRRNFLNWTRNNGGDVTWAAYCALEEPERREIAEWLESLPLYYELRAGGRDFLLTHAGVGNFAPEKDLQSCSLDDFIWGRTDYSRVYYEDRLLITGHTPTVLIDPRFRGKIWRGNNHIAIDCGAVFFGALGCLCLDTLEEYYIHQE